MSLVNIIKEQDEESLRGWATDGVARVLAEEDTPWHDAQDGVDSHDPAMLVTLAADRGEITREQRSWALEIVRGAYAGRVTRDEA